MFKKYLQQPLGILLAGIVIVRAVLDRWILENPGSGPSFDLVCAVFVLAIPVVESGIFYRAYRAYQSCENSKTNGNLGIANKIILPLLFFCMPYGLWNSRRVLLEITPSVRSNRWFELAGVAVGCGFNLVISDAAFHSLLKAHFRAKQAT